MVQPENSLNHQPKKSFESNVQPQFYPIWIFDDVSGVSDWLAIQ
jgi:hypothetical protein